MHCVVCGKTAGLMCLRCGEPYCQDVCQRTDWQRHKYFCIIMPPLINARPLKQAADAEHDATDDGANPLEESIRNCNITANELSTNDSTSALAKTEHVVELSSTWRTHSNPPEKDFFECRITFVENEGAIWVVESINRKRLERLTDNIARCIQDKEPCDFADIEVGDLVCVGVDQKMYRGEIMTLQPNHNCATVRLIDIGIIATIDIKDIYLAVSRMAEIKAYAFKVMLPHKIERRQINKDIYLRLLGTKTQDGIMQAEVKCTAIPLELPLQMLANNSVITWLTTLQTNTDRNEPQVALMQMNELSQLNEQLNSILKNDHAGHQFTKPFPDTKRPFFLAARTKQGYRRAFLIDFVSQTGKYLIYEMDEGCFSIVDEVLRIPNQLLAYPPRTFGVILPKEERIALDIQDLSIKFDEADKDTRATLLAQNEKLCAVRAVSFTGQIAKELNCKYFQEPIPNGSLVYITSVLSYHEICISSVKTKEYSNLFKELERKCPPFSNASEIALGSIVLVVCVDQGTYRGEVASKMDNGRYRVLNIDTGTHHLVPSNYLRMSCAFLEHLPVSLCRSSIKTICNIPSTAVPPNSTAMNLLMKLYDKRSEMLVKFSDANCSTLDLMDLKVEPHSLMTRLLPMMFTACAVELQPAQNIPAMPSPENEALPISSLPPLPPSPPSSPTLKAKSNEIKRHYFDDIKHELLPLHVEISIMVLSTDDMKKTGCVTGCYFSDEKAAEDFQNLLNRVAEVGSSDKSLLTRYVPDIGEMCLAIFSEDNSWYRGVCLRVTGDDAYILFCDYGNKEMVPIEKIKSIPADLTKKIFATKCFIDGFNKSDNFEILEDYLIAKNKINCIASSGSELNTCVIRIPTLAKILSKELI